MQTQPVCWAFVFVLQACSWLRIHSSIAWVTRMDSRKQYSNASGASCNKHKSSADWLCLHLTPCPALCAGENEHQKEQRDQQRWLWRVDERNNQICALACARSAPLPSHNLLPRVQPAPSRFQCARRIKCHFVFNSSDYLFFAHFPPPERISHHLFMCDRAQKPERFSHILTALHTLHVTYFALYITQVSSFCEVGCMLCQNALVAILCHYLALRLLYALRLLLSRLPSINSSLLVRLLCLSAILVCLVDICSMWIWARSLSNLVI